PLTSIFQAQTLETLAARILETEDEDRNRSLIRIQQGLVERLPFLCVHPAGGDILGFQDLAKNLGADIPFYGFQSPGRLLDDDQCHASLEEMAEHYIAEMRSVQPAGPYLIGGHSMGAIVAFEMARQLERAGCEIGLLAALDGELNIE